MELECGKLGSINEALKDFGTTYGIPIGQRVYFCCISVDLLSILQLLVLMLKFRTDLRDIDQLSACQC